MIITINKDDLRGEESEPKSCPLFRALKRQGYNVKRVGVFNTTIDDRLYNLDPQYLVKIFNAQQIKKDFVEVEVENLKRFKKLTFITRILNKLR